MILEASRIKTSRHAGSMATHLLKSENEVVEQWESLGGSLQDDLVHMQQLTKMTRGKTGIFHVAINPRQGESLSRDEYAVAVDAIEARLGLTGQLRTQTYHVKDGRGHLHVCWSLVDQERGILRDPSNEYYALQEIAQELEQAFCHEQTNRAPNPESHEYTVADRMQAARTGLSPKARKELVTALWEQYPDAQAFTQALGQHGYALAKGRKAAVVLLDGKGGVHNLVRDLPKGIRASNVRARFTGISLQTVAEAERMLEDHQQRAQEAQRDKEPQIEVPTTHEQLEAMREALRRAQDKNLEEAQDRFEQKKQDFAKTREREEAARLARDDNAGKSLTPGQKRKRTQESLRRAQVLNQMAEMFRRQYQEEKRQIQDAHRRKEAMLVIQYNKHQASVKRSQERQQSRTRDGGREAGYDTFEDATD